jgi:hypothetical protein
MNTNWLKDFAFREIALGHTTLKFYSESELIAGQIGYSIGVDGESLVGQDNGDWKREWLVIGYEDCCGDPLFVDSLVDASPVYTAAHGQGEWTAIQIADSSEAFGKTLTMISDLCVGRENPMKLEKNPIDSAERRKALSNIKQLNPTSDTEFWELLLRQPD